MTIIIMTLAFQPHQNLRRLFLWDISTRALSIALFTIITVWIFYYAGINKQKHQLADVVKGQSALIRAMASHAEHHYLTINKANILDQLRDAQESFPGIGETGEISLAHIVDEKITFLLHHRNQHDNDTDPTRVPMDGKLAEPMRRALQGKKGVLEGVDYRGKRVFAAYYPLPDLGWGIVAKIDFSEVSTPYFTVGGIVGLLAFLVVIISAYSANKSLLVVRDQLNEINSQLNLATEAGNIAIWIWNIPTNKLNWNDLHYDLYGIPHDRKVTYETWRSAVHPDDILVAERHLQEALENQNKFSMEFRIVLPDGGVRHVKAAGIVERNKLNQPVRMVGVNWDISEMKRTEKILGQHAVVFESVKEAVVITDVNRRIQEVNQAFTDMTGYSAQEAIGGSPRIIRSGQHDDAFYDNLYQTLEEEGQWRGEIWNRHKNGEIFPVWESITAVKNGKGELTQYIAIFSDISEKVHAEERTRHLANHDALTDLPNRLLLSELCERALEHAKREKNIMAVMYLDLDQFKPVNDKFGHSVGDEMLQSISSRLKENIRESDTIARLGGDEFSVILEKITHPKDAVKVASNIIESLGRPFEIKGNTLNIGVSIGISIYLEDGENMTSLVKNADEAMYRAKQRGRNCYEFYSEREL
ncbi:hypothetical protein BOW17_01575 [Solemya velum gill symbiont]|nr:hypothetical protein BOW17_01575 [Solemya velum gill symbiont]